MPSRQTNQSRIINHTVDLFQGGLDTDASPYRIAEGAATTARNVEFYRDNTLRSRLGYKLDTQAVKEGQFIVQRVNGIVSRFYKQQYTGQLVKANQQEGQNAVGFSLSYPHNFVRVLDGVLYITPEELLIYNTDTPDGFVSAAIAPPTALQASPSVGGKLKEGKYTYTYNYLLKGGADSQFAPEVDVSINTDDSKVTLTIPEPQMHYSIFKLRIYRKDPNGGFPLLIKELEPDTTSYTDTGDSQSALLPTQGVRAMPPGSLALIQNRRLFTCQGNIINYSYPGNYAYGNVFWTEKVNLPTGEPIRAMCPLGQGIVFFGLETAIYMNSVPSEGGTFSPLAIPDGCVSQTAWTQAEDGTLLYVGKSGVYAMQGASAQRISDALNPIFESYTVGELSQATVVFDQQNRRLLVALPNEIIVYYFQTKAWSVWDIPGASLDWFEGQIHIHLKKFMYNAPVIKDGKCVDIIKDY